MKLFMAERSTHVNFEQIRVFKHYSSSALSPRSAVTENWDDLICRCAEMGESVSSSSLTQTGLKRGTCNFHVR